MIFQVSPQALKTDSVESSNELSVGESAKLAGERLDGLDRDGRIFNPIIFLSRTTTNLVFTSAITTTLPNVAVAVTFTVCTPTDVSTLIGPACPAPAG